MIELKQGATILFQGDSITHGGRGDPNDPNHAMGHGYAFNIASEIGNKCAEKQYRFMNRGISGNSLVEITERWKEDTLALEPDLLSLLSGINDLNVHLPSEEAFAEDARRYEERYRNLIELTQKELPECKIVVIEPFTYKLKTIFALCYGRLSDDPGLLEQPAIRAAHIKPLQETVKKLAEEYGLIFVPMQDLYNKALERAQDCYWNWDSLHPTYSGHYMMSRRWLEVVTKEIKF